MKLSNFTKCQLTVDKILKVAEGVDKSQKKMRICYNVAESINKVPYRQSISYSESTSLVVKIPLKQKLVTVKFHCKEQFH